MSNAGDHMRTKHSTQLWVILIAMIAFLALSAAPAHADYEDSLLSYWKFDDEVGGVTPDATDHGNDGTANGGAILSESGIIDSAYSFNGTGYISTATANLPVGNASRTVALWVKLSADNNVLLAGYGGLSPYDALMLFRYGPNNGTNTGKVALGSWGGPDGIMPKSTTIINPGFWYHISAVFNGTTASLYVNGRNEDNRSRTYETTFTNMDIGRLYGYADLYVNGFIDDVAVWNRALTAPEIEVIYKMGIQRAYDLNGSGPDLTTAVAKHDALEDAELGFDNDVINQLIDVYSTHNTAGITIGNDTWRYIAHEDPIWIGHEHLGEKFTGWDGKTYVYLGGGVGDGEGGAPVPEPATVAGLTIAMFAAALRRRSRR